jgi:CHAT domain-containing protein
MNERDNDLERAKISYRRACKRGLDISLSVTLQASRNWGDWAIERKAWSEAIEAYSYGIRAVDHLYQAQTHRIGKEAWLHKATGLYDSLAYAYVRVGQLKEAIVILERGRTFLLLEAIGQKMHRYKNPISSPTFEDIEEVFQDPSHRQALVYVVSISSGSLALIVYQTNNGKVEVKTVWTDKFTYADINTLQHTTHGVVGLHTSYETGNYTWLEEALVKTLPHLGRHFIKPIAKQLQVLGITDVTLIPGGRLSLLPLHAASYQDPKVTQISCLLDKFNIAYAPSARTLSMIQQRQVNSESPLLALGNPQPNTNPASFTDILARDISQRMQGKILLHEAATIDALQSVISEQHPRHLVLGCHGTFDATDPLNSGVELSDGRFTLERLLNSTCLANTGLVVLCACKTAISDFLWIPNESLGLPIGFLQAGAKAVIGTLWSVYALPTVLLLSQFYEVVAEGVAPAQALRQSMIWLRELEQPEFRASVQKLKRVSDSKIAFDLDLLVYKEYVNSHPFHSPIYWAAFIYYGSFLPGEKNNDTQRTCN